MDIFIDACLITVVEALSQDLIGLLVIQTQIQIGPEVHIIHITHGLGHGHAALLNELGQLLSGDLRCVLIQTDEFLLLSGKAGEDLVQTGLRNVGYHLRSCGDLIQGLFGVTQVIGQFLLLFLGQQIHQIRSLQNTQDQFVAQVAAQQRLNDIFLKHLEGVLIAGERIVAPNLTRQRFDDPCRQLLGSLICDGRFLQKLTDQLQMIAVQPVAGQVIGIIAIEFVVLGVVGMLCPVCQDNIIQRGAGGHGCINDGGLAFVVGLLILGIQL